MAIDLLELAEEWPLHVILRREAIREVGTGYVLATSGGSLNVVRMRLRPDDVGPAVAAVRARLRSAGIGQSIWWCGSRARPSDLQGRLHDLGLEPDPGSPALSVMILDRDPSGVPTAEVRRVESLEDHLLAMEIGMEGWNVPTSRRERERARAAELWADAQRRGLRGYLAYVDGDPVATANGYFLDDAVLGNSAATLPRARRRGAYASLVHARWREAVAAGTPTLLINAGPMSTPVLEQLGFRRLGEIRLLVDRL